MYNTIVFNPGDTLVLVAGKDYYLDEIKDMVHLFQESLNTDKIIICREDALRDIFVIKQSDNPFLGGII